MLKRNYHCENNELVELSILHYKEKPIAPVLLSQKLFLTRPVLFHYIERRDALEASANELFEVLASGKVGIDVNQRFSLKVAAGADKALEAHATSGSAILTI